MLDHILALILRIATTGWHNPDHRIQNLISSNVEQTYPFGRIPDSEEMFQCQMPGTHVHETCAGGNQGQQRDLTASCANEVNNKFLKNLQLL